jgi:hypothetical protein
MMRGFLLPLLFLPQLGCAGQPAHTPSGPAASDDFVPLDPNDPTQLLLDPDVFDAFQNNAPDVAFLPIQDLGPYLQNLALVDGLVRNGWQLAVSRGDEGPSSDSITDALSMADVGPFSFSAWVSSPGTPRNGQALTGVMDWEGRSYVLHELSMLAHIIYSDGDQPVEAFQSLLIVRDSDGALYVQRGTRFGEPDAEGP